MKFDYIIQNPPYKRSLHLTFLEKGYEFLSENGHMITIEPATWLMNFRTTPVSKKYFALKDKFEGHCDTVIIKNYNRQFHTAMYVPFSVTRINKKYTGNRIEFTKINEKSVENSLYDCNMIGPWKLVQSILEKCQNYGDMMNDHIYKPKK